MHPLATSALSFLIMWQSSVGDYLKVTSFLVLVVCLCVVYITSMYIQKYILLTQENKTFKEQKKNIEKELETYQHIFEEWDTHKTEFISIASHQLRTPLTIIRGYMELLDHVPIANIPEELKEILSDIRESNEKLITVVHALLEVAQIEQGAIHFQYKDTDLREVCENMYEQLLGYAKSNQVELVWDIPERPLMLFIDKEKIHHVLFNFVENAIKYTEQGTVRVQAVLDRDALHVIVTDSGCGFEPDEALMLFEKFYRSDEARKTQKNGTGLGLYIAKHFIEGHHGKIWGKSFGLGKGSEFGFSIPYQVPPEHHLYSNAP